METYEMVEVPAETVLSRRATCSHAHLGPTIGKLFSEIMRGNPDATLGGPPCIYYIEWNLDTCLVEAAAPLDKPVEPAAGTEIKTLPARNVIRATYRGPYEGLADAWIRLWAHIKEAGLVPAALPPWDCYVTDPGEEPDSSQWITELNVPIAG